MSDKMSVIKDEQENYSMARVLLVVWTLVLSSVYMFLCAWAGGPRAMQYLAPVIGSISNAIGQSKNVETSTDIQELSAKIVQTTKATENG